MSVVRPQPPEDPIAYDPAGLFAAAGPYDSFDPRIVEQPDRLLADYKTNRTGSELFAILGTARRVREAVDRVVMLGSAECSAGPRAVFEACCHPFHNELSRGERGGRPRLSFAGEDFDNDSAHGLLDLVAPAGRPRSDDLLDRWAILVAGGQGEAFETAAATRLFLAALEESLGGDRLLLADRVVPIAGRSGRLAKVARAIGSPEMFEIPDGVPDRFSVFTAVGLLPAAIVGIDVVRLLEGAAAMNRRFREAPAAENPVLQYAGATAPAAERMAASRRVLTSATQRLGAVVRWYEHVRPGGSGTPSHDVLVTNVVAGEPRRDRLVLPPLGPYGHDEDGLDDRVGTTWPDLQAAVQATHPASPTAEIRLPRIDEHAVGQLLQMLMLATLVEARLADTKPP
jgi:glucose-6-phosphate isomerase